MSNACTANNCKEGTDGEGTNNKTCGGQVSSPQKRQKRHLSDSTTESYEGPHNKMCRYGASPQKEQKRHLSDSTKENYEGPHNKMCKYRVPSPQKGQKRCLCRSTNRNDEDHKQKIKKSEKEQQIAKIQSNVLKDPYPTLILCKYLKMFWKNIYKECNYLESTGLNKYHILQNIEHGIENFLEYTKYHNDFVLKNLVWFRQRLYDIYLNSNPYIHKTITMPKSYTKFRPLSAVVVRKVEFRDSKEDSLNAISNVVIIDGGIVAYSLHYMALQCSTTDSVCHMLCCPSPVSDMARVGKHTVIASIPFQQKLLIFNPSSFEIKTLNNRYYKISYLKSYTFVGLELFSKMIYLVNWVDGKVEHKFAVRHEPRSIAIGPHRRLLVTFVNTDIIVCYNLNGRQLFQLNCHSIDIPTEISVYKNYFYVLQGRIIYKISSAGGVSQRSIETEARYGSLITNTIVVTDYFGNTHKIITSKDFWPRLSFCHQVQTPSLNNQFNIGDPTNIKEILPMSVSYIIVIFRDLKVILFNDDGQEICRKSSFQFQPSAFCRVNSSRFLVLFREHRKLQYITLSGDCTELNEGHLIDVDADYTKICHISSNMCLALTTNKNKELHILLINKDKVVIGNKIPLEHVDVTIAATPFNFVVADKRDQKLIFYSSCGEVLLEKYLDSNGIPNRVYSDALYFHVFFNRESTMTCYDISGDSKWQLELPWTVSSHIGIVEGTVYVVDVALKRVLIYKYPEWSSCNLSVPNPYITNINIRRKENNNNKVLISEVCYLPNGQLVVSVINSSCLLYISNEGEVESTLPLPSLATDVCRWDGRHIGVTLPIEKELWVISNLSKRVRIISLSHRYVRVRKLGENRILCLCDKPHHLDIVSIQNQNHSEIISTVSVPFVIKSLAIEDETLKALIVTKKKVFEYDTSSTTTTGSILLHPNIKPLFYLYGGCIDKMFVYLIDECRMFAANNHNLVVRDYVTRKHHNMFIDLVDVFSRNICVSEKLSSTLYLQDLTVSDKAQHVSVPKCFRDNESVRPRRLVITENNLIAVYDSNNNNIKILTFDGQLLDSITFNTNPRDMRWCRWRSNTLVITTNTDKLFTLKVEFPLSLTTYYTPNIYNCIASSDNLLVCISSSGGGGRVRGKQYTLSVIDIDEIHSSLCVKIDVDITERLRDRDVIYDIVVTANDDIIVRHGGHGVVGGGLYITFFNHSGKYLHSHLLYIHSIIYNKNNNMTVDNTYLYIGEQWAGDPNRTVCWSQTGEYERIFLNKRHFGGDSDFSSINCKGPRFVGTYDNYNRDYLYVEGLFYLNRERFTVCRLQTDMHPVQIKDIDISDDEGQTVVCEKANSGNVKIFLGNGELLCHRDLGTSVGGVCFFTGETSIMVTLPHTQQIFQLNQQDLRNRKVWSTEVPYGVIWRKVKNIYWCVHINLTEYHTIQIDDNKLNILERTSLLKPASVLHFPTITSQINNGTFSNELNNILKYSRPGGTSGETVGEGRLMVRYGNYMAGGMSGNDEISVRVLPHRTTMFLLDITTTCDKPSNYKCVKLIMLQDNVAVLMYYNTLTVTTTKGDILQQEELQQQPEDMCRWTDECFIVLFNKDKQLMFYNKDLSHLKTINNNKDYNRIYKYTDYQLVCAVCSDEDDVLTYVDVVNIVGETCQYSCEVCSGVRGKEVVKSIGVTSSGDIVVVKGNRETYHGVVCWYRKHFVRSQELRFRPRLFTPLTNHGENVYITDNTTNIYQTSIDSQLHLYLDIYNAEVLKVYQMHVSDDAMIIFGPIIRQPPCFAFFHYDK